MYTRAVNDLEHHYEKHWGPSIAELTWKAGPKHELPDDFTIEVFRRAGNLLTYATLGLSNPEKSGLELFVIAPRKEAPVADASIAELLTATAHYHLTGSRLDVGHIVDFGRPWLLGARSTRGLVSLPYLDGPELEWFGQTRILWLIPITEQERQLALEQGLEALEQALERSKFEYWNPKRASVV
jgi:hypothetical protein